MTGTGASSPLLSELNGAVLTLTLNQDDNDNCLSTQMIAALHATFEAIEDNAAVRVVIIAASGSAFCAGHDLNESAALPGPRERRVACLASNDMMLAVAACSKVTVARVQGRVTGAGLELIASSDLAIAADNAEFSTIGVNCGLWDHTAQVALSRLTSRKFAMELLLTGAVFNAADAVRMGLVNRVVPLGSLDSTVAELSKTIAAKSPYTVALGKYSYDHQAVMDRTDAYEFVSDQYYRDVQSEDAAEGLAAMREQREPHWKGR